MSNFPLSPEETERLINEQTVYMYGGLQFREVDVQWIERVDPNLAAAIRGTR